MCRTCIPAAETYAKRRERPTDKSVSFNPIVTVFSPISEELLDERDCTIEEETIISPCVDDDLQRDSCNTNPCPSGNEKCVDFNDGLGDMIISRNDCVTHTDPSGIPNFKKDVKKEHCSQKCKVCEDQVRDETRVAECYKSDSGEEQEHCATKEILKHFITLVLPCIPEYWMFMISIIWLVVNHFDSLKGRWQYMCRARYFPSNAVWNKICQFVMQWECPCRQRELPAMTAYKETRREIGEEDARTRPKEH